MFDFSFDELLVICVVGLLILGPKELPKVARALRRIMRQVTSLTSAVRAQINEVLDDEDIKETTRLIKGDDGAFYEAFDMQSLITDLPKTEDKTAIDRDEPSS